ncbi:hypothetical protein M878_46165 (plasmid) [Streptomyces roseochromogenus subsp. oscitans DS 12.976]|uniref:Uncharacterized protein n=1 Tax=Streptomyces roseochromogenus subsp. oscitans DS 12.976 TaxID=1352936 RepID=V6JDW1_STRRC|nr:hypothetical protein M878_46165 [Streptomyces roseochromogenus subsp. oscitans DS 12.976]
MAVLLLPEGFDTSRWPRAKYIPLRAVEERLPGECDRP